MILCVGNLKSSGDQLFQSGWWKEHASEHPNRLKVNRHLQVEGIAAGNVFCLGDAAFLPENQMGFLARTCSASLWREAALSCADPPPNNLSWSWLL